MPLTIPPDLLPLITPRTGPVPLRGTAGQIAYAASVRRSRLAVLRRSVPPHVLDLLYAIEDSTWWLGNRSRPLSEIRWPEPSQLSPPDGEQVPTSVAYEVIETQRPSGANPRASRESEVRRSVGDLSRVSSRPGPHS